MAQAIEYGIEFFYKGQQDDYQPISATTDADAMAKMREWVAVSKTRRRMYLSVFRSRDGFRGYLNPDGAYSATGKPWSRHT
jgi:hypothetical protein